MEKKICQIYKIVSPSGRIYIGKTSNLKLRVDYYRRLKCKKQPLLYYSLLKYGFSGHSFDVIYEGEHSLKEINEIEIKFINEYKSFHGNNENGMNLTLGGDGGFGIVYSEERKQKIREANKNRIYKPHSEESKKLISENRKKTGKTEAHRLAIEKLKGRKVEKTEEWVKNNAESIKKPIFQYDLEGNFIKEWKSAKDVELEIGLSRKNISANLRNKTKHAYGYIWKYKKNN
jgi:group I intron endonuclease